MALYSALWPTFADPLEIHMITVQEDPGWCRLHPDAGDLRSAAIHGVMDKVREHGLHEKAHIPGQRAAHQVVEMATTDAQRGPGMRLPDELVERIERANGCESRGHQNCVEKIEQLKRVPGVHGIHNHAVASEDSVRAS